MRSRRLKIRSPSADAPPPHHNACLKGIEIRQQGRHPFTVVLAKTAAIPMRFLWRRLCHVSAGTNVALALGGLRGATIRTIQIAAPATHARYAGWSKWRVRRPSRCRLIGGPNAARCQNGGTRLCRPSLLRRERELWQLSTISLGNRPRAAGYRIAAAVLSPANPGAIQVCSCSRFTRLVLVQLIFLVTDR